MSTQNPTQKGLGPKIQGPPAEGEQPAPPTCPKCGREMPGLYMYAYNLAQPAPLPILVFQACCCPFEDCRATLSVYKAAEIQNKIAAPGVAGWPT